MSDGQAVDSRTAGGRRGSVLSPFAQLTVGSQGARAARAARPDAARLPARSRSRSSTRKAFRRLAGKTQVFLAPEGDHYRTRITHTLEVAQFARTVTRFLGLNELLTEAIVMGHDLGHTPFGHAGEKVLAHLMPDGFHHVKQSLRVVEQLERDGAGLNLTRRGARRHPEALEGQGRHLQRQPEPDGDDARGADRAHRRHRRLREPRPRRRRPRRPRQRRASCRRRDRARARAHALRAHRALVARHGRQRRASRRSA